MQAGDAGAHACVVLVSCSHHITHITCPRPTMPPTNRPPTHITCHHAQADDITMVCVRSAHRLISMHPSTAFHALSTALDGTCRRSADSTRLKRVTAAACVSRRPSASRGASNHRCKSAGSKTTPTVKRQKPIEWLEHAQAHRCRHHHPHHPHHPHPQCPCLSLWMGVSQCGRRCQSSCRTASIGGRLDKGHHPRVGVRMQTSLTST